ncbi:hypothetical protein B484DRAFT_452025 [Ochromonadaceae sp. CCMP2298]|nr:hypothetical protein B484DRAFT_452025 [Ochromonadaceae sp. CCMP2298]
MGHSDDTILILTCFTDPVMLSALDFVLVARRCGGCRILQRKIRPRGRARSALPSSHDAPCGFRLILHLPLPPHLGGVTRPLKTPPPVVAGHRGRDSRCAAAHRPLRAGARKQRRVRLSDERAGVGTGSSSETAEEEADTAAHVTDVMDIKHGDRD